jgi:hypothetical protein
MRWINLAAVTVLLSVVGIGCGGKSTGKAQTVEEGLEQLRPLLAKASPEVQSNLYSGVAYSIRYGNYLDALAAMDRIVNDPSLKEPQKKKANEVIELLKAKLQTQENAPKP